MTHLDDFDRSLAAFLADGPTRAPEAPLVAAMAHARTSPRTWDPFAALRRDVMASPVRIAGLRPAYILAAAALAAAAIGVAVVGSQQGEPTLPPAPSASLAPSIGPTTLPNFQATIPVRLAAGGPLSLDVTDTTGELLDVVSETPGDGASIEPGRVQVAGDPAAPTDLLVTWSGSPCATTGTVLVDEGSHRITIDEENCSGDAVAFDRILRIVFADPVDAAAWSGIRAGIAPSPSTAESAGPTPAGADAHLVLRGSGRDQATLDIIDGSGHFVSAQVATLAENEGPEAITATNVGDTVVRLAWPGSPCDKLHLLTIAADFGLTLDRPTCYGDAIPAFYAIEIVFDEPVVADALDTALQERRQGTGLPSFTVTGIDSGGGLYDLAVFDQSGRLTSPEPFADDTQPADPGPTAYTLERTGDASGRLIWRAPACAADVILRIDPTATEWHVSWKPCEATATALQVVDLTFDHLPDTTGISVTIVGPEP